MRFSCQTIYSLYSMMAAATSWLCPRVQVLTAGTYEVVPIYTSNVPGTFKWSVGTHNAIRQGNAPSITARLPAQVRLAAALACLLHASCKGAAAAAPCESRTRGSPA
jgi:hypothetical protein